MIDCHYFEKALWPNDFNLTFFEHFWDLFNSKVFHTNVLWLEFGEFPAKLMSA